MATFSFAVRCQFVQYNQKLHHIMRESSLYLPFSDYWYGTKLFMWK